MTAEEQWSRWLERHGYLYGDPGAATLYFEHTLHPAGPSWLAIAGIYAALGLFVAALYVARYRGAPVPKGDAVAYSHRTLVLVFVFWPVHVAAWLVVTAAESIADAFLLAGALARDTAARLAATRGRWRERVRGWRA